MVEEGEEVEAEIEMKEGQEGTKVEEENVRGKVKERRKTLWSRRRSSSRQKTGSE